MISNSILSEFNNVDKSFTNKLDLLFNQQIKEWPLAKSNYTGLKEVRTRDLFFDKVRIRLQFNPTRINSTSAKVDKKSIEERACFLCNKNLPKEQKAIEFGNYLFLVNPYPIFNNHFTIASTEHTPQNIYKSFKDFLDIAKSIGEEFTIFYNGPKCGASAPDHLHFQCGNKNEMPICANYNLIKKNYGKVFIDEDDLKVFFINDNLRNFLSIESNDKEKVVSAFNKIYKILLKEENEEPLLNIIADYNDKWIVKIIPRKKHRPQQFYEEGDKQLLVSPASVDIGGLCIIPRDEDFKKLNADVVKDIFNQVCLTSNEIESLLRNYKK